MTQGKTSGFMVFHSNRMEGLRDLLVQYVKDRPLPPLASETILVQSNGMKHWLTLSLAAPDALGICAATQLALPSSALWQIYRTVLGADKLPTHMPLDKSPLVWRIMRRLPAWLDDPRFTPLAHYLQEDTQGLRALGLAQQLADVLDGYQNYRVDWLHHWAGGKDQLHAQLPLPPTQAWQAALWRDLLADVKAHLPAPDSSFISRSDVHQAFVQALQHWPVRKPLAGLPPRLMVFGITALPMQTLQALAALGRFIPVLMFVHNPSFAHWGHLSDQGVAQGHPLLAAWGKHGRDYLHAINELEDKDELGAALHRVNVFIDPAQEAHEAEQTPSALQQLQSAVLHMAEPPSEPIPLEPGDDSISFAQTHSMQRELEVLHDRLLAWLDADPRLQPSDIMVMVPDMAAFAPHIQAVFGRFTPTPASEQTASRHLPYSVADTTSQADPVIQALQTLLQLPQLRISLNDWLALFQVQAVRERFAVSQNDVVRLQGWLAQAGVRWGLDAQHRQAWGISTALPDAEQNTWGFGLQRLLLGYAQGELSPAPWHNTLGQAGINGLDAPLVASVLRWLQAMDHSLHILSAMHTPTRWVQHLQDLIERFFTAHDEPTQRLLEGVLAPLEDWLSDCQLAQFDAPVSLSVVRSHWLAQMDAVSLQRRFMGGGVQFATLMPMRAIPYQVVCLLGMNDGVYPRSPAPRDFDLMSHPGLGRAGDRARREDDRYLFLEAVLSARQRLYISWQGRRASDHAVLPPSVLVGQLMDHLNVCHRLPDGAEPAYSARLQPLQAFSAQYADPASGFVTYAQDWAASRQAATQHNATQAHPMLATAHAPLTLNNQALALLLRHPQEVYFQHRLQTRLDSPAAPHDEDEPFAQDNLSQFILLQELLHSNAQANTLAQWKMQGRLALGDMGTLQQAQMMKLRDALWAYLDPWLHQCQPLTELHSLRLAGAGVTLDLQWGGPAHRWYRRADSGVLHIALRPGKVMDKKRPRLHTLTDVWIAHLCANAAGESTTSVLCATDGLLSLLPLGPAQAQQHLIDLGEVYLQAWAQPLPLACKTACAWLTAQTCAPEKNSPAQTARQATAKARSVFEGGFGMGEVQQSPSLQRAFPQFDDIWPAMQAWAHKVYGPLLQACNVASLSASPDASEGQT